MTKDRPEQALLHVHTTNKRVISLHVEVLLKCLPLAMPTQLLHTCELRELFEGGVQLEPELVQEQFYLGAGRIQGNMVYGKIKPLE